MVKFFSYILTFSLGYSLLLQLIFIQNTLTISLVLHNTLFLFLPLLITCYYLSKYGIKNLSLASHITLCRLIIVSIVFSSIIFSYFNENYYYSNSNIILLSFIALILDWMDGYFARLLKEQSSFGELFDQEVDNFLMLTLAVSLHLNLNISPIIFLIPLSRYIFVFCGLFIKWLNGKLPFSWRRKYICGGVIVIMIFSHLDFLSFFFINVMSIISVMILIMSFVYDVILLYRRRNYA